jgi:hypothetical protein
MAAAKTRRPTVAQVRNAGAVLSRALMAEAERIREEQGHIGHVAAQELEHDAIRIGSHVARIEAMRRARP